jgi:hypothetical protein
MPTNKDFKRLVRGRMQKTGESYTAARARLLRRTQVPASAPSNAEVITPADYARLAGMSDAAVKAKTGCTWARWVNALDRAGAYDWPHREIARHVAERYETSGWWAQTVTVGYERIKGIRAIGQRRDGTFEANKSRTIAVPLATLSRAFSDKRTRARWLPDVDLPARISRREHSIRIMWPDATSVELYFTAKGAAKSQVQVQHRRLADRESAIRMKRYWDERLDTLARVLTNARARKR